MSGDIRLEPLPAYHNQSRCQRTLTWYEWGRLNFNAVIAAPSIIIGFAVSLIGTIGLITTVGGFHFPGLGFVNNYMPASIVLFLILMRAGIHLQNGGVAISRKKARWRQEGINDKMVAWLKGPTKQELSKAAHLIYCLGKETWKILPKQSIHGKMGDDIAVEEILQALPELAAPNALAPNVNAPQTVNLDRFEPKMVPKGLCERFFTSFYDKVYSIQKALGVADLILGQVMFAAAICAVIFMCSPAGHIPPGLSILASDPYLSIAFTFILLSNWIDCTKRGLRMLTMDKREKNRADIERDLSLIVLAKEIKKSETISQEKKNQILEALKKHLIEEPVETTWYDKIHQIGKKIMPQLGTPSILLGTVITLLGLAYLAMSVTNSVPASLDFLMPNNKTLSILFSVGLVGTGLFAVYRGFGLNDMPQKKNWKKLSKRYREHLLNHLFNLKIKDLPDTNIKVEEPKRTCLNKTATYLGGSITLMIGAFCCFCSLVGLIASIPGVHISDALDFIIDDPNYSAFFCTTLFAVSLDTLMNGFRMFTYQDRKMKDFKDLKILEAEFNQQNLPAPPNS